MKDLIEGIKADLDDSEYSDSDYLDDEIEEQREHDVLGSLGIIKDVISEFEYYSNFSSALRELEHDYGPSNPPTQQTLDYLKTERISRRKYLKVRVATVSNSLLRFLSKLDDAGNHIADPILDADGDFEGWYENTPTSRFAEFCKDNDIGHVEAAKQMADLFSIGSDAIYVVESVFIGKDTPKEAALEMSDELRMLFHEDGRFEYGSKKYQTMYPIEE